MVTINIDGSVLEVQEGKNILDCALEAGIYIPHLCHHPNLSQLGSCRLCVVEVEGSEGITTSCTLQANEGMSIRTNSEVLKQHRMLALELLLSGHPECTSCPKYGNCELQMLIQYIGPKSGRLHTRSKGFKVEEGNPLIVHDMNRCVLCGRCVRACNELRGAKVLQYNKKNIEAYIGTLHDKLLVDADCKFCGACAEVCPTGTIRDKKQYTTTSMKREDFVVPCRYTCPAHTDVPRYVRLAKEGKFDEAAAVIREKVPFPKALGYICNHLCESECNRSEINQPISIRNIKRYVAERDTGKYWKTSRKQSDNTGKKICIIGGGPAGMTAAYYLRKQGHEITIKEALPELGGMLQYGIPSYRLPRHIINDEIKTICEVGIKVETNMKVENIVDLLTDFDAVLVSTGGHKGVKLPIEGCQLNGVILNTDFLRNCSMNKATEIGDKVVVLGGGNVAFDCGRSAKRLGATEVYIACLESEEMMPADKEEIEQAMEEGIHVLSSRTFEKIVGTSCVEAIEFMEVKSFEFDENRRPLIVKREDSIHRLEVDTVIFSVGQRPDLAEGCGLELNRGYIVTDQNTCETTQKGIFAAGDVVYGTNSVVKAVASGRKAAEEIDRFLGGDGDISEVLAPIEILNPYIGQSTGFGHKDRIEPEYKSVEKRRDNFDLINQGIKDGCINEEAGRCLQCDLRLHISPSRTWSDYTCKEEV